jgi:2-haloacid dehalogenase
VEGLTRLKSKFIIAPCSNGNIALITNMAKRAGLPWDVVLGAEVAQAYKPDPQAYLGSADALGLKPEECMMVAAHQDDLDAAAELGMATAYVLRPDEFGPDVTIEPTRENAWTHVAESFMQLADQTGC